MISGTLSGDAERCVDKNSRPYIRFTVTCGDADINNRTVYTHYQCTCYMTGYENMKKGDQVFLTGRFSAKQRTDDKGKTYMNLNVMVYQITGGYRADEKTKSKTK